MYNDKTGDKNEENDILKCFKNTTKAMNTVADANVDSDYEGPRVIAMVTRVTDSGFWESDHCDEGKLADVWGRKFISKSLKAITNLLLIFT